MREITWCESGDFLFFWCIIVEVMRRCQMEMCGVCLITKDVIKLAEFYEEVFQTKGVGDEDHVAFEGKNLALWNPGNRDKSKHVILMFYEDHVEDDYKRLKKLAVDSLTEPEIKPWGVKVITFKDSDGHGVHFLEKL